MVVLTDGPCLRCQPARLVEFWNVVSVLLGPTALRILAIVVVIVALLNRRPWIAAFWIRPSGHGPGGRLSRKRPSTGPAPTQLAAAVVVVPVGACSGSWSAFWHSSRCWRLELVRPWCGRWPPVPAVLLVGGVCPGGTQRSPPVRCASRVGTGYLWFLVCVTVVPPRQQPAGRGRDTMIRRVATGLPRTVRAAPRSAAGVVMRPKPVRRCGPEERRSVWFPSCRPWSAPPAPFIAVGGTIGTPAIPPPAIGVGPERRPAAAERAEGEERSGRRWCCRTQWDGGDGAYADTRTGGRTAAPPPKAPSRRDHCRRHPDRRFLRRDPQSSWVQRVHCARRDPRPSPA